MSNLKYAIGIDVSKKDFHCCLSVIDTEQLVKVKAAHKFQNTVSGFKVFFDWLNRNTKEPLPICCVMEATGVYHEQLAWFLHHHNQPVSILLPNKAKKYLQANGAKSKNDSIDSKGLAQIGAEKKLGLWTPPSKKLYDLRSLTRQHQSLTEFYTALNNQLEAIHHSQFKNKAIIQQLNNTMALLKKQISAMEDEIEKLIKADEILANQHKNITAIKGIGTLSFAVVVAETNGFALFKSAASLVSYKGYDVVENQSGSHVGRTKISKKGNSRIRRILHMPALCAIKESNDQLQFRNLYLRIYQRTGIKMKGVVGVQKKLLMMMYHLWRKNEIYQPSYNHQENIIAPEPAGATHDKTLEKVLH